MRGASLWRVVVVVVLSALLLGFAGSASAAGSRRGRSAAARISLLAARRVSAGGLLSLKGQLLNGAGASVVVQRRSAARWTTIVEGRAGNRGRFVLTWIAQGHAGKIQIRAVAYRGPRMVGVSAVKRVVVRADRGGQKVVVSPKTRVLTSSTVISAPQPGTAGVLRYSGGNDVQAGQIIAIGPGPATPDGFLAQVTNVRTSGDQTIVSTKPATLLQAVPSGSFDEQVGSQQASVTRAASRAFARAADASVTCTGSVDASVDPSMSFGTSIDLNGSWSGGLQSARLTAGADATASLTATVEGQGSCTLQPVTIVNFDGPGATFFVGPVPVVLTSEISIDVDANASAQAKVTTGITTGFSAQAGVGWTKNGGFYPIQTFTPNFGFTPPTLTADAGVDANLTPKIDVLLYGVAGPQLALKAGVDLNADISQNPWWTLSAPVDLTASLDIPALNLSSPSFNLYHHTFTLAHATGPFGGGGPEPGATVSVTNPGSQTGTVGTPASLQIQATDTDGGALSYTATGLPAGLSINPTTGLITGTPTVRGSSTVIVDAQDGSGPASGTTFTWTIAGWAQQPIASEGLSAVSCVSTTMCMGVGHTTGSPTAALTELWNGSSWTVLSTPSFPNQYAGLFAVSCPASNACVAVGWVGSDAVSEIWNGTTWTTVSMPSPGSTSTTVGSVSCLSASSCMAVGDTAYDASGDIHLLAEHWDGSAWTVQSAADPYPPGPDDGDSQLFGISCVSGGSFCMAVGQDQGPNQNGRDATLAETWNGSGWTITSTPNGASSSDNILTGVSCSAADACTAVGNYTVGSPATAQQPLVQRWDGGNWTSESVPVPPNTFSLLYSDACISNSFCATVGAASGPGGSTGGSYGAFWSGTGWTTGSPPDAPDGSVPLAISCVSNSYCVAVGFTSSDVFS